MVKIQISYSGGLRTRAVHGPTGCVLETDAPKDNQGLGEAFSPTDLVATGLGTCVLTIMAIVGERNGLDLSRATVEVEKVMSSSGVRKIVRLEVAISVPGISEASDRARLEAAAKGCPVHATIGDNCEMNLSFDWPA